MKPDEMNVRLATVQKLFNQGLPVGTVYITSYSALSEDITLAIEHGRPMEDFAPYVELLGGKVETYDHGETTVHRVRGFYDGQKIVVNFYDRLVS